MLQAYKIRTADGHSTGWVWALRTMHSVLVTSPGGTACLSEETLYLILGKGECYFFVNVNAYKYKLRKYIAKIGTYC